MKNLYRLAFILVIGAAFALAQAGAGQSSQTTPATSPSQTGAQSPDNSQMGKSESGGSAKAQSDIQSALRKQLPASADNVTVSASDNNKVQLTGTVSSETEKQQVEQIAHSAAPNVDIDNKLNVSSTPSGPGSLPPSGSQPPSGSKPPMLRLVAFQATGSQTSPASQSPTTSPSSPSDQAGSMDKDKAQAGASGSDVQDKIQKAIQQDSSLSGANINVSVNGDKVDLTGTVASKDQKKTAKQIAESNAGGMKVMDHLKVSGGEASPTTPPKN